MNQRFVVDICRRWCRIIRGVTFVAGRKETISLNAFTAASISSTTRSAFELFVKPTRHETE